MVQSQYLSVLNTEMRITEGLIKQIMPKDVALQVRLFFILFYSGKRRNFHRYKICFRMILHIHVDINIYARKFKTFNTNLEFNKQMFDRLGKGPRLLTHVKSIVKQQFSSVT